MGDVLSLKQPKNCLDRFSAAVMKNNSVVSHVPKERSPPVYFFISRDGHGRCCEVTGRPTNHRVDLGLEVSCVYIFYGHRSHIDRLIQLLQ